MTPITDHWLRYKTSCYPDGCSAQQEREVRQAFMSGALIILGPVTDEICTMPNNDMGAMALEDITQQVLKECREHKDSNFARAN